MPSKQISSTSGHRRRDVLRILALGGAAAAIWGVRRLGHDDASPIGRSRVLMGTEVHLTVVGDDPEGAARAADSCLEQMAAVESRLSRYREDSEVSRLNRDGRIAGASTDLLEVLQLSRQVSDWGSGAFDVTVQPLLDLYRQQLESGLGLPAGTQIDQAMSLVGYRGIRVDGNTVSLERPGASITLDGVGKGYVVDRGIATLRQAGFMDVFVEAGGDLVAGGSKQAGQPWRVGIRNPRPGLSIQARFEVSDRAVATSGDYMQPFSEDLAQHHILDPRTGRSAPELASSTVIAGDAATADALATVTMVLGPARGLELLEELPECEGYLVTKSLEVLHTSGFTLL